MQTALKKKTSTRNDSRIILHVQQEYNSDVKEDSSFQRTAQF